MGLVNYECSAEVDAEAANFKSPFRTRTPPPPALSVHKEIVMTFRNHQ